MAERWPYDAAENDPLTAVRLAVVSTAYPDWYYLVSICINEDTDLVWRGKRPTEAEVTLLLSELEFERSWYRESYLSKMAERPFDIDGGFNSLTFVKRGYDDWAYRRRTWEYGPILRPSTLDGEAVVDLAGLLDWVHEHSTRWSEWKAAHPETFWAAATTADVGEGEVSGS